ncbi:MAG TPA: hypothetical protein VKD24_02745 [Candidatus Angelobacter sp.]|nr:hypothetical protein [Candidatus Angelobacter sp.]
MIVDQGVYEHITEHITDYYADPCPEPSLTQSIAKTMLEYSAQHAFLEHPRLNKNFEMKEETYEAAKIIGTVAHALLLGRGRQIVEIDADSFRSKSAQEKRDAAFDSGLTPVLSAHLERATAMVKAARRQLDDRGLSLDNFLIEAMIVAKHDDVWLRSLVDAMSGPVLVDYKTGGFNAAPHALARKMISDGVHIQAAFHELILDHVRPGDAGKRSHWFVFQENFEPYALTAVKLDEQWLTMGRRQVQRAVRLWTICMADKQWPAYPLEVPCPQFPSYKLTEDLDAELREEDQQKYGPGARRAFEHDHLAAG